MTSWPTIAELMNLYGFELQVWPARYGGGFLAALGPCAGAVDALKSGSGGGDLEAGPVVAAAYERKWMPIASGPDAIASLDALEERIARVPPEHRKKASAWARAVTHVLDEISKAVASGEYSLEGWFDELPAAYEQRSQGAFGK